MSQPAVFLDRDGTVIVDQAYLDTIEGVELLPRAARGLVAMAEMGYLLVLITNQSGVARGYFAEEMVMAQYQRLQLLLESHQVSFAAMKYCPHAPDDDCDCRKPSPAMLQEAARELDIDLARSFMIGDKTSDVLAGQAAGCTAIRIGTLADAEDTQADYLAQDLMDAASFIKQSR